MRNKNFVWEFEHNQVLGSARAPDRLSNRDTLTSNIPSQTYTPHFTYLLTSERAFFELDPKTNHDHDFITAEIIVRI